MSGYDNILLSSKKYKAQKEYWLNKFRNFQPELMLEADFPESTAAPRKEKIEFPLESQLSEVVLKISKGHDLTLYVLLLAVFKCLLYKITGKTDLSLISPVYLEDGQESPFNQIVVLRDSLSKNLTFKEILIQIRESAIEAYQNQDYPMDKIFTDLKLGEDTPGGIICDIVFRSNNIHPQTAVMDYPMIVSLTKTGNHIDFTFEFDPGRYRHEKIGHIINDYLKMLKICTANPNAALSSLDILSEEEKRHLLYELNDTQLDFDFQKTIPQVFEELSEKIPDNIAVVFEGQSLTYHELNQKANQIARYLKKNGIEKGDIVGIMVERSLEMITGILGIMKAGGAYLPVLGDYPAERVKFMLKDSGARLLLTQSSITEIGEFEEKVIDLKDPEIYLENSCNLEAQSQPNDLAYIIYTSGSTGKPKGVMIEHKSVINLVAGLYQKIYAKHPPNLRVAILAPCVFDASVQQIFGALLQGHSLYIVPDEDRRDGEKLIRYYTDNKIDITDGTPTHLNMLNTVERLDENLPLLHLIIGGEALPLKTVETFFSMFKGKAPYITNIYGPTECCVDSTAYLIDPQVFSKIDGIPIGKALANGRVYILGQNQELVPDGVVGEVYIAGPGVGRGYLGQPQLTAERFLPDILVDGEIMYKTGDLGRWLPDGNIDFLGRIDHQVKIRGFRIELGEIETQLLKEEYIKEAAVIARKDPGGGYDLCAYLVAGKTIDKTEVKEVLLKQLPDYMIPTHIIQLEKMPLTLNGKVDRKALPEPNDIEDESQCVAPRDQLESKLVELWAEILGLKQIGINRDFFQLGGHSLKAALLVSRIQKELKVDFQLNEVFRARTIEEQANSIKMTLASNPHENRPDRVDHDNTAPGRFMAVGEKGENYQTGSAMDWFTVKEAAGRVWAIGDNFNNTMYLVAGNDKAVLIDTGYGIGNLAERIASICHLPAIVVNTHGHPDHVSGNNQFSEAYLSIADWKLLEYCFTPDNRRRFVEDLCKGGYPEGFSKESWINAKPNRVNPVTDGQIFDLGGRALRTIEIPGHTGGCIALLDEKNGFLFAGDSILNNNIWMHLEESLTLSTYFKSLQYLKSLTSKYDTIMPSHGGIAIHINILDELIQGVSEILDGRQTGSLHRTSFGDYLICRFPSCGVIYDQNRLYDNERHFETNKHQALI